MGNEIGKGSFGVVFQAKWRHIYVAVKKLFATEVSQEFHHKQKMKNNKKPNQILDQFDGWLLNVFHQEFLLNHLMFGRN